MNAHKKILTFILCISMNCYASDWQCFDKPNLCRLEVPHGWLIKPYASAYNTAISFYPDNIHQWKIKYER